MAAAFNDKSTCRHPRTRGSFWPPRPGLASFSSPGWLLSPPPPPGHSSPPAVSTNNRLEEIITRSINMTNEGGGSLLRIFPARGEICGKTYLKAPTKFAFRDRGHHKKRTMQLLGYSSTASTCRSVKVGHLEENSLRFMPRSLGSGCLHLCDGSHSAPLHYKTRTRQELVTEIGNVVLVPLIAIFAEGERTVMLHVGL